MRSVNSNLFEINAAKSRVKAAQAAGQTPADADLALIATEVQRAYATAQYSEVMTIEQFAKHIATHGCVYSRADIAAILYMAVDCMREQLLEGKKIRLGDLGDFSVAITCNGAESAEKFNAQSITGLNVVWDCGTQFKNLLQDASFNLVATRSAQAKVIKAIKSGESTVDLTPEPSPTPTPPANGGNTGGNSSGGTSSGGSTNNDQGGSTNSGSGTQNPPVTGGEGDGDDFGV